MAAKVINRSSGRFCAGSPSRSSSCPVQAGANTATGYADTDNGVKTWRISSSSSTTLDSDLDELYFALATERRLKSVLRVAEDNIDSPAFLSGLMKGLIPILQEHESDCLLLLRDLVRRDRKLSSDLKGAVLKIVAECVCSNEGLAFWFLQEGFRSEDYVVKDASISAMAKMSNKDRTVRYLRAQLEKEVSPFFKEEIKATIQDLV